MEVLSAPVSYEVAFDRIDDVVGCFHNEVWAMSKAFSKMRRYCLSLKLYRTEVSKIKFSTLAMNHYFFKWLGFMVKRKRRHSLLINSILIKERKLNFLRSKFKIFLSNLKSLKLRSCYRDDRFGLNSLHSKMIRKRLLHSGFQIWRKAVSRASKQYLSMKFALNSIKRKAIRIWISRMKFNINNRSALNPIHTYCLLAWIETSHSLGGHYSRPQPSQPASTGPSYTTLLQSLKSPRLARYAQNRIPSYLLRRLCNPLNPSAITKLTRHLSRLDSHRLRQILSTWRTHTTILTAAKTEEVIQIQRRHFFQLWRLKVAQQSIKRKHISKVVTVSNRFRVRTALSLWRRYAHNASTLDILRQSVMLNTTEYLLQQRRLRRLFDNWRRLHIVHHWSARRRGPIMRSAWRLWRRSHRHWQQEALMSRKSDSLHKRIVWRRLLTRMQSQGKHRECHDMAVRARRSCRLRRGFVRLADNKAIRMVEKVELCILRANILQTAIRLWSVYTSRRVSLQDSYDRVVGMSRISTLRRCLGLWAVCFWKQREVQECARKVRGTVCLSQLWRVWLSWRTLHWRRVAIRAGKAKALRTILTQASSVGSVVASQPQILFPGAGPHRQGSYPDVLLPVLPLAWHRQRYVPFILATTRLGYGLRMRRLWCIWSAVLRSFRSAVVVQRHWRGYRFRTLQRHRLIPQLQELKTRLAAAVSFHQSRLLYTVFEGWSRYLRLERHTDTQLAAIVRGRNCLKRFIGYLIFRRKLRIAIIHHRKTALHQAMRFLSWNVAYRVWVNALHEARVVKLQGIHLSQSFRRLLLNTQRSRSARAVATVGYLRLTHHYCYDLFRILRGRLYERSRLRMIYYENALRRAISRFLVWKEIVRNGERSLTLVLSVRHRERTVLRRSLLRWRSSVTYVRTLNMKVRRYVARRHIEHESSLGLSLPAQSHLRGDLRGAAGSVSGFAVWPSCGPPLADVRTLFFRRASRRVEQKRTLDIASSFRALRSKRMAMTRFQAFLYGRRRRVPYRSQSKPFVAEVNRGGALFKTPVTVRDTSVSSIAYLPSIRTGSSYLGTENHRFRSGNKDSTYRYNPFRAGNDDDVKVTYLDDVRSSILMSPADQKTTATTHRLLSRHAIEEIPEYATATMTQMFSTESGATYASLRSFRLRKAFSQLISHFQMRTALLKHASCGKNFHSQYRFKLVLKKFQNHCMIHKTGMSAGFKIKKYLLGLSFSRWRNLGSVRRHHSCRRKDTRQFRKSFLLQEFKRWRINAVAIGRVRRAVKLSKGSFRRFLCTRVLCWNRQVLLKKELRLSSSVAVNHHSMFHKGRVFGIWRMNGLRRCRTLRKLSGVRDLARRLRTLLRSWYLRSRVGYVRRSKLDELLSQKQFQSLRRCLCLWRKKTFRKGMTGLSALVQHKKTYRYQGIRRPFRDVSFLSPISKQSSVRYPFRRPVVNPNLSSESFQFSVDAWPHISDEITWRQTYHIKHALRTWKMFSRLSTRLRRIGFKMALSKPFKLWCIATTTRGELRRKLRVHRVIAMRRLLKKVFSALKTFTSNRAMEYRHSQFINLKHNLKAKKNTMSTWLTALRLSREASLVQGTQRMVSKRLKRRIFTSWLTVLRRTAKVKQLHLAAVTHAARSLSTCLVRWRSFRQKKFRSRASYDGSRVHRGDWLLAAGMETWMRFRAKSIFKRFRQEQGIRRLQTFRLRACVRTWAEWLSHSQLCSRLVVLDRTVVPQTGWKRARNVSSRFAPVDVIRVQRLFVKWRNGYLNHKAFESKKTKASVLRAWRIYAIQRNRNRSRFHQKLLNLSDIIRLSAAFQKIREQLSRSKRGHLIQVTLKNKELRLCWEYWKSIYIRFQSRKSVLRGLIDRRYIRPNLSKAFRIWLVIHSHLFTLDTTCRLRRIWVNWKDMTMAQLKMKKALSHRNRVLSSKCLIAWRNCIFQRKQKIHFHLKYYRGFAILENSLKHLTQVELCKAFFVWKRKVMSVDSDDRMNALKKSLKMSIALARTATGNQGTTSFRIRNTQTNLGRA